MSIRPLTFRQGRVRISIMFKRRCLRSVDRKICLPRAAALLLLCAGIALVSCSRKPAAPQSEAPSRAGEAALTQEAAPPSGDAAPAGGGSEGASSGRDAPIAVPSTSMKSLLNPTPPPRGGNIDAFVPSGGEGVRYPRDYQIGELGPGSADRGAYTLALAVASAAAEGKGVTRFYLGGEAPPPEASTTGPAAPPRTGAEEAAEVAQVIAALGGTPRFRVGGAEVEADASVSFLLRFFTDKLSASGELQLRRDSQGAWGVLTFVLDPPESADGRTFDPLTYTRFL